MPSLRPKGTRLLHLALLCFLLPVSGVLAQQPVPTPQSQAEDILRINAELVQTDVMVFDKEGHFIDNLQRDQFELRVDGKPQPVAFFDRVNAGSASEEAQLAAARGTPRPAQEKNQPSVGLPDRGRVIIFFIDDLHLTPESLKRTRQIVLRFIDKEMGQNDQVAIATTSGQIGFLQQLTDNKNVLRAAIERLTLQPQRLSDGQRPPMSEYLALAIIARHDPEVLSYFVEALIRETPGLQRDPAEVIVMSRAQQILQQSNAVTRNTLRSLDSLAHTVAPLPGRKLVFFISDGFLLNTNESDISDKLSSITDVAARNGVVIYTMDARGLSVDPSFDASTESAFDTSGRISRASFGELSASQDALRTLAGNTGGRALLNTNALDAAVTKTLKETSTYYVLAWRPENEEQKNVKLRRLDVKIKGHPDYVLQFKRGFLTPAKEPIAKSTKANTPAEELQTAINTFYRRDTLPTALALNYQDSPPQGALLTISMQIPIEALAFEMAEGKQHAMLDIAGYVFNDKGQPGSGFHQRLNVSGLSSESKPQEHDNVSYTSQVILAPGLYQVRVAARDAKSGRIGNATEWIEIPDLKAQRLSLSSLFIGEVPAPNAAGAGATTTAAPGPTLSILHRFAPTSRLRFLIFIYNATRGAGGTAMPDVAVQVQILRDDQPVMTTTLHQLATEGISDLAHLPYAADIPLDNMAAGRYLLKVTAIDRIAKTSASQQVNFEVE